MKQAYTQILLTFFLCTFLLSFLPAQIIRGKVFRSGEPQNGLTIQKKGRGFKYLTDPTGRFLIKAKVGDPLHIRRNDTTWIVLAEQDLQIELANLSPQAPDQVEEPKQPTVYSNDWGDTLGAVTQLEHPDFNQGNIYNIYGLIQGRVPGLTTAHPGGDPLASYKVQLRGLHTFDDFSLDPRGTIIDRRSPLLVIDGLPSASLLSIDPANILSIKVLRDAASAAEYGIRGANGVVEIETQQGKAELLSITYHSMLAQESPMNLREVLSAEEFTRRVNTRNTPYYRPQFALGGNTDWQKAITRTGWNHNHQLGIGGSLKNTSYHLALHYRDQQGIAKKSGFNQWNTRLRLVQKLWKDRLELGIIGGLTMRSFQDADPMMFIQASFYNPTSPVYSDTLARYGGYQQQLFFHFYNPVAILEQTTREGSNQVSTLSGHFKLTPIKGLMLKGQYAFQSSHDIYGLKYPRDALFIGLASGGSTLYEDRNLDNQFGRLGLFYSLPLGKSRLRFQGNYTYQQWDFFYDYIAAREFSNDNFSYDNTDGAAFIQPTVHQTRDKQSAYYGSLEYHWNNTLFLQAGMRREGASRNGPANKWAWFPAVRTALSLHHLMDWKNRFHLRLNYGVAGQIPMKNFAAHWSVIEVTKMYYNGSYIPAYDFINTPNPSIGEERRAEWNIGLDLGLSGNRIQLRVDYYDSKTKGIEAVTELPSPPYPQIRYFANYGALQNRGLEVGITTHLLDKAGINWNSQLQLFTNTTHLLDMNHPAARNVNTTRTIGSIGFPGACCGHVQQLKEGEPIGRFYGPIFQEINTEGQWVMADLDNSGYINSRDYRQIGNAQPDLQLAWNNDLKFGQFDLSFQLRGILGHNMMNTSRMRYEFTGALGPNNVLSSTFTSASARLQDYPYISDYYVEDASFVRLEYLTLGYNFKLPESAVFLGLRLYLTAQRLFTISGYSGLDPDLWLDNTGNQLAPGIAHPSYLSLREYYYPYRSFLVGVRVKI